MTAGRLRIRVIIPVWGNDYVERWLALAFPALLADGNLRHLNERSDLELIVMTKAADLAVFRNDWRFIKLTNGIQVSCITIDEFFPPRRVNYGVPLTLAYAKAIAKIAGKELNSFVVLLNADFILSKGSLANLLTRIEAGYTVITAPSIRVPDHVARPRLLAKVDLDQSTLSISGREMIRLVNDHPHSSVLSRTLNSNSFVDSTHYHLIYWRVSNDFLIARYFLLMPLCFQVQRKLASVVCPVDYGFITEVCPDVNFSVMNDSDDLLLLELQDQHSESSHLRLSPRTTTLERRLQLLASEIAANAAEWTTLEHRRSAGCDLYFHSEDIPFDIERRTETFRNLVDEALAALPPAVSHVGHFHWLGALGVYRTAWGDGAIPLLLDDLRNLPPPVIAVELPEVADATTRGSLPNCIADLLTAIGSAYRDASVLYLGDIEGQVPAPPPQFRRFKIAHSDAFSADMHLSIGLPDTGLPGEGGALVLFATTNFLPHWRKVWRLTEDVLRQGSDVFLVCFVESFTPVVLADHSWMLSNMLYVFTSSKYETAVEAISASDAAAIRSSLYGQETISGRQVIAGKILDAIRSMPENPMRSTGRLMGGFLRLSRVLQKRLTKRLMWALARPVQSWGIPAEGTSSTEGAATSLADEAPRAPPIPKVAGFFIHMRRRPEESSKEPVAATGGTLNTMLSRHRYR